MLATDNNTVGNASIGRLLCFGERDVGDNFHFLATMRTTERIGAVVVFFKMYRLFVVIFFLFGEEIGG